MGRFFEYADAIENNIKNVYDWRIRKMKDNFVSDECECLGDYDSKEIENNITECLMHHKRDDVSTSIKGGKYVSMDDDKHFNMTHCVDIDKKIKHLPLCNCGLPCDVNLHVDDYLYFRCPKKNMWEEMKETF